MKAKDDGLSEFERSLADVRRAMERLSWTQRRDLLASIMLQWQDSALLSGARGRILAAASILETGRSPQ